MLPTPGDSRAGPPELTPHERAVLLGMARLALEQSVRHGAAVVEPMEEPPPRCREVQACFVTLTKNGELRGCIGTLTARGPLCNAVMENARGAALRDTRFLPVTPGELAAITLEISVLSPPERLAFTAPEDLLAQLHPSRDGVVLTLGMKSATFLPQVWAQIPDKIVFLDRLCQKAGLASGAWREPGVAVETYRVEHFGEGE